MDVLINELKILVANSAYYSSLINALIVPDICAALQSENGKTSGAKYEAWFDHYCTSKHEHAYFNGKEIYKIRCALLHQGKLTHDNPSFNKIIFKIPSNGNMHNNLVDGALILDLRVFVEDIISGYEEWKIEHFNTEHVISNLQKTVNYYPNGWGMSIIGVPVIF